MYGLNFLPDLVSAFLVLKGEPKLALHPIRLAVAGDDDGCRDDDGDGCGENDGKDDLGDVGVLLCPPDDPTQGSAPPVCQKQNHPSTSSSTPVVSFS